MPGVHSKADVESDGKASALTGAANLACPAGKRARHRPTPHTGRAVALSLFALAALSCRFMPEGGHWVEGHGHGQARRLAGWPSGVVAIGVDGYLWAYPTNYANPWTHHSSAQVRHVAASSAALYAVEPDGTVIRFEGVWRPYAGSASWGAAALAATSDDHLFVLSQERVWRVNGELLEAAPCPDIAAKAMAALNREEIYVIDKQGRLYRGTTDACTLMPSHWPVRDVSAHPGRIVLVTESGEIWRRRGNEPWRVLPKVRRYRAGSWPEKSTAVQVTLSAYSTWLLDDEGGVFLLSDET